jgi:hypothetical protein
MIVVGRIVAELSDRYTENRGLFQDGRERPPLAAAGRLAAKGPMIERSGQIEVVVSGM